MNPVSDSHAVSGTTARSVAREVVARGVLLLASMGGFEVALLGLEEWWTYLSWGQLGGMPIPLVRDGGCGTGPTTPLAARLWLVGVPLALGTLARASLATSDIDERRVRVRRALVLVVAAVGGVAPTMGLLAHCALTAQLVDRDYWQLFL